MSLLHTYFVRAASIQDLILKTALDLIAKQGLERTSFQQIADKIGKSQAAIIHYYPTKKKLFEGLLSFIVKRNTEHTQAKFTSRDSAQIRLQKHFRGHLEWAERYPADVHIILVFYTMGAQEAQYAKLYAQVLDAARAKIEEMLHAGVREKLWQLTTDDEDSVTFLLHDSLLSGIVNWLSSGGSKKEHLALRKRWNLLFKKLLGIHPGF